MSDEDLIFMAGSKSYIVGPRPKTPPAQPAPAPPSSPPDKPPTFMYGSKWGPVVPTPPNPNPPVIPVPPQP